MLPALYRPAVYYLRVVCGEMLLVPDVLSVVFHVMSFCVCSRGGRFPSLVGWGGHSLVVRVSPDCLLVWGSSANLAWGMAYRMSSVWGSGRSFLGSTIVLGMGGSITHSNCRFDGGAALGP